MSKEKIRPGEFCKIVWVGEFQILVSMNYNDEDDIYELVQKTSIKGGEAQIKVGCASQKNMRNLYVAYSDEMAAGFINTVKPMFG